MKRDARTSSTNSPSNQNEPNQAEQVGDAKRGERH